jgi:hypothetical protein
MESPPASDFPKQIKKKSGSTLVPGPKIRSNQAISVALHRTAYLSMVKWSRLKIGQMISPLEPEGVLPSWETPFKGTLWCSFQKIEAFSDTYFFQLVDATVGNAPRIDDKLEPRTKRRNMARPISARRPSKGPVKWQKCAAQLGDERSGIIFRIVPPCAGNKPGKSRNTMLEQAMDWKAKVSKYVRTRATVRAILVLTRRQRRENMG